MNWSIEPEVVLLVNSVVALEYRVLPLGCFDGRVRLLTDEGLNEEGQRIMEQELSFHLGTKVELEVLGQYPEITREEFARELNRCYNIPFPETLSRPVGADLLTVLLIDPNVKRGLALTRDLKDDGYEIIGVVPDIDKALRALEKTKRKVNRVFVWHDANELPDVSIAQLEKAAPCAQVIDMGSSACCSNILTGT